MAKDPNSSTAHSNLPEPGAEPAVRSKGSADEMISQLAGDELEKLLQSAEAEENGTAVEVPAEVAVHAGPDAAEKGAVPPTDAGGELESEVVGSVLEDAGKVREGELDELFAELTKTEAEKAAAAAAAAVPAKSPAPAAEAGPQGVGPILRGMETPEAPAEEETHTGPPFLAAVANWKPDKVAVDVLKSLADPEHAPGTSWLVRLLMIINRPFDFLSPEVRENVGYVACVVMISAIGVAGWAILRG